MYTIEDAKFDAQQQGREAELYPGRCRECGRKKLADGSCVCESCPVCKKWYGSGEFVFLKSCSECQDALESRR